MESTTRFRGKSDPQKSSEPSSPSTESAVEPKPRSKWVNWWIRLASTLAMFVLFYLACSWRQESLLLLVFVVQAVMYYELVTIAVKDSKEKQLPGFWGFYIYWFLVAVFYAYGNLLMPHLLVIQPNPKKLLGFILRKHLMISYLLYIAGFVAFVISLRKRRLYRYQFKQYAFCHITLFVVVFQSTSLAANLFAGLLWFILPCALVVANDSFAYVFGFLFGRHKLTRLSPKKTWEGFIGGGLATLVIAFWLAKVFAEWELIREVMLCPKIGLSLSPASCTPSELAYGGVFKNYPLQEWVKIWMGPEKAWLLPFGTVLSLNLPFVGVIGHFSFSALQIHAVVLAVFASLIAPFGGFFASGFKRAFAIKDFGTSIPGHGGFTDRMDCQLIMGIFAFVYFRSIVQKWAAAGANCSCSDQEMLETILSFPQDRLIAFVEKLNSAVQESFAP